MLVTALAAAGGKEDVRAGPATGSLALEARPPPLACLLLGEQHQGPSQGYDTVTEGRSPPQHREGLDGEPQRPGEGR